MERLSRAHPMPCQPFHCDSASPKGVWVCGLGSFTSNNHNKEGRTSNPIPLTLNTPQTNPGLHLDLFIFQGAQIYCLVDSNAWQFRSPQATGHSMLPDVRPDTLPRFARGTTNSPADLEAPSMARMEEAARKGSTDRVSTPASHDK